MKKRKIIIAVGVIISVVAIVFVTRLVKVPEVKFDSYERYSMSMSIDVEEKDKVDTYLFEIYYDGTNARINSSTVNKDSYLIDNKLYYLDGDTYYWHRVDKSFLEVASILSNFDEIKSISEDGDRKYYEALPSKMQWESLLENIYFEIETKVPVKVNLVSVDDKIVEFSANVEVDDVRKTNMNVTFEEMDSDFVVNTSRIFGNTTGGRVYKLEETETNVFKIK